MNDEEQRCYVCGKPAIASINLAAGQGNWSTPSNFKPVYEEHNPYKVTITPQSPDAETLRAALENILPLAWFGKYGAETDGIENCDERLERADALARSATQEEA